LGEIREEVAHQEFLQFLFQRQWQRLRREAHARGIRLFEMPRSTWRTTAPTCGPASISSRSFGTPLAVPAFPRLLQRNRLFGDASVRLGASR
jgi:hypothetical protein